jgi:hypothetical protein
MDTLIAELDLPKTKPCVLVLVLVLLLGVTCAGLLTDEVFVLDGVITETLDLRQMALLLRWIL